MMRKGTETRFRTLRDGFAKLSRKGASMDVRAKRTRQLLVRAFDELLAEKPLQDISVSEICERSTVRRGTFYRHFEDKHDFFKYYLTTITDQFLQQLSEGQKMEDLFEYASHMHRSFVNLVAGNRALRKNYFSDVATAETIDLIVNQVADGIVERIKTHCAREGITPAASPEFIGLFYSGGLVQTLRWWVSEGQPISVEELEGWSTAFLLRYLEGEGR